MTVSRHCLCAKLFNEKPECFLRLATKTPWNLGKHPYEADSDTSANLGYYQIGLRAGSERKRTVERMSQIRSALRTADLLRANLATIILIF